MMKKISAKQKLVQCCLAFFFLLATLPALAQPFDSVLSKLDSRYPQEKLYLQLDKSSYNPGETIWYKAYLFSGIFPSAISKTLYTELLDDKGQLLQRRSAPFIFSGAAGAFDLPADYKGQTVYLRAYTRWMLNFDSAFLYDRAIPVFQPVTAKSGSTAQPTVNLHFFPEGGDLVQGVQSRVAFKATDNHGLPVEVQGDIKNNKGVKVTSFKSVHDGMGYLILEPRAGETYTAVWKDPAGKTRNTTLPAAHNNGVVLETQNLSEAVQFKISRPANKPVEYPYVYVVAQMQQQLLYRARASLQSTNVIGGAIPTANIPSGIMQITLFDMQYRPLAERIVFVNKDDYYFITDLNSAVKDLGKRGKNVIQIDVPDTIPCNLSVSVTDDEINPANPSEGDIFSGLMLSGDIRGYVHHPSYYFSSDADSVKAHLDLVMMTNGWRRFRWEEVLANKWPDIKYLPENYLALAGKINGLTRTELVQRELTGFFVLKNGNQQFMTLPVTTSGDFGTSGMIFYDTAKFYYQFNNDKDKILTSKALFDFNSSLLVKPLEMSPDSNLAYLYYRPAPQTIAKAEGLFRQQKEQREEEARRVKTLAAVTVTARQKTKQEQMDEEYTSGFFSGGDGYTFLTDGDPSASPVLTVLQYLQGKVAGLQIITSGNGSSGTTLTWRGSTPALFLNEMQGDVSLFENLTMNDVAMVKVFRPPFFGAPGGGSGGAIAVYTKKGQAANNNVKGLDFSRIPGYSPVREFYSPDYSSPTQEEGKQDLRSTLYWNPFVFTGKENRRIYLTFYNNDITRKYRVVIEGINTDGKLTRIEKVFQ